MILRRVTRRHVIKGGPLVGLAALAAPVLGGCSLPGAPPRAVRGPRRIGYMLVGPPPPGPAPNIEALRDGLRVLGYTEGKDLEIEYRWLTPGADDHLAVATELVNLPVDLIVASAVPAVKAAKQATSTIPIVMVNVGDPVAVGLVDSLAHPGGNVTGVSTLAPPLSGKRLEILQELQPTIRVAGVLGNIAEADKSLDWHEVEVAGAQLGVRPVRLDVTKLGDIEPAFAQAAREDVAGLVVLNDDATFQYRQEICELAIAHGWPAATAHVLFARSGGLFSYGPSTVELHRRAATYVDKLLTGTRPDSLPVERPTRFELVVNKRTADALGLKIPQSFLVRVDEML